MTTIRLLQPHQGIQILLVPRCNFQMDAQNTQTLAVIDPGTQNAV